jgi:hypothetical protein
LAIEAARIGAASVTAVDISARACARSPGQRLVVTSRSPPLSVILLMVRASRT